MLAQLFACSPTFNAGAIESWRSLSGNGRPTIVASCCSAARSCRSGRLQRRVAPARAFITEPSPLLLDQPFLSLDAPVANRLRRLLLDLCEKPPPTVLFVTHDLRQAVYSADRVLFMSSRPGCMVLDLRVELARPRDREGEAVEAFRLRLLKQHPKLLAGLSEAPDPNHQHRHL